MSMPDRDAFLDFVLGEATPEQEAVWRERLASDPELARRYAALNEAQGWIREAADFGWDFDTRQGEGELASADGATGRVVRTSISSWRGASWVKPAIAVAAVLMIGFALLITQGRKRTSRAVYEPDVAFGYLLPEEADAAGRTLVRSDELMRQNTFVLRRGEANVASVGSTQEFALPANREIPAESEIRTTDTARIDLPHGGIVFAAPFTDLQVRRHQNGDAALRLMRGTIAVVSGGRPIHMAIHGTDLLVEQASGASMMRKTESDVLCLRGELTLRYAANESFRIHPGTRLPAVCAHEPVTSPISLSDLDLDWYFEFIYGRFDVSTVVPLDPDGRCVDLPRREGAMLFVTTTPDTTGTLYVTCGNTSRAFEVVEGETFRLRVKLDDWAHDWKADKPVPFRVDPAHASTRVRLFTPPAR